MTFSTLLPCFSLLVKYGKVRYSYRRIYPGWCPGCGHGRAHPPAAATSSPVQPAHPCSPAHKFVTAGRSLLAAPFTVANLLFRTQQAAVLWNLNPSPILATVQNIKNYDTFDADEKDAF
jgi:hypothetical protein